MKNIEITSVTSKLLKSDLSCKQDQPGQEREMRDLTGNEVLSVAGGPEVDISVGGG